MTRVRKDPNEGQVRFILYSHSRDWPKDCFLLNLQKEIAAPRQRELDDGQPGHMVSAATLATTLDGTRSGLGLCFDSNTAGVYCAFGVRFERSRKPESVHPFNQCSNLRFDGVSPTASPGHKRKIKGAKPLRFGSLRMLSGEPCRTVPADFSVQKTWHSIAVLCVGKLGLVPKCNPLSAKVQ